MWNSVIKMPNAKFGGANIKNMYLKTPLNQYEYMKMQLRLIPNNIIEHYGLREKAIDGYVYMEIRKGMYGLPQAGILASKLLKHPLACHGYFKQPHMPSLWKHAIEEEKCILTDTFLSYGLHMTRSKSNAHFVCRVCRVHCSKLVVNRNWWCGAGQTFVSSLDSSSCVP